jgi:NosR/NirI family nitrous oxide reductase transcriptional regulator
MSIPVFICSVLLGGTLIAGGRPPAEGNLAGYLKRLFPSAAAFSAKEGAPPHFKAFASDPRSGSPALLGFAFWTTELEPLERGYDGPIKILVGMDTKGILSGIVVVDHHEPYGYFSVEPPEFAAQFAGKSIRDPFKIGADVDAVSRASITIASATRAVRNSARRVARQLLAPPESPK